MPRKTHGRKTDPREALIREVAELGRRFEEAVGAAVTRPEFREGMEQITVSIRGAAAKLAEAAAAARTSEEGEAFVRQAEKVAKTGKSAGAGAAADFAKRLASGLKNLASELEGFAEKTKKKR